MITLKVEENNPITSDFYDQLIANLPFHRLTCPCGHSGCLSVLGYYHRFVKTSSGLVRLRVCRVICSCCGHTHALLPSFIVPYSQVSVNDQAGIIQTAQMHESLEPLMARNPLIDESICRYVIRQFKKHWKQRFLSIQTSMVPIGSLIGCCFQSFSRQFMQIRCTQNRLFFHTT